MSFDYLKFFPRGIAQGVGFCNRDAARVRLREYFATGTHTWLSAPRRYGKTSLALQAVRDARLPVAQVDLLTVQDAVDAQQMLAAAAGRVVESLRTSPQKLRRFAEQAFAGLRPKVVLGSGGPTLEFDWTPRADHGRDIITLLRGLDQLAIQSKRRVVVMIDEFQELAALDGGPALEGAVRSVAQDCQALAFVFAGSNQHLLDQMFEDPGRPLYRLCEKFDLGPLDSGPYAAHIQQAARIRWGQGIEEPAIARIFELTECHPYYGNLLCRILFEEDQPPNLDLVDAGWLEARARERQYVAANIQNLTQVQRRLMKALALQPIQQPGLPYSSIQRARDRLFDYSLIHRTEDGRYVVTDPLIRHALART